MLTGNGRGEKRWDEKQGCKKPKTRGGERPKAGVQKDNLSSINSVNSVNLVNSVNHVNGVNHVNSVNLVSSP